MSMVIWQAIEFSLQFSGFHLASRDDLDPSAQRVLQQPLPEVDRNVGPLSLEQALLTLVGEINQLPKDLIALAVFSFGFYD